MSFIELLKELSSEHTLNHDSANKLVRFHFPNTSEFATKTTKNLFNKLVSHEIVKVETSKLPETLKLLDIVYKKLYTSLSTLDSYFSKDIRNPIKEKYKSHSEEYKMSKQFAKLSYQDKGILINQQRANLIAKHQDQETFESSEVKTVIATFINSKDPFERMVCLALVSGCRPAELFNPSIGFEALDSNWVRQDFLAKKRGKTVSVDKPIIFLTAKDFITKLDDTRAEIADEYKRIILRTGELNGVVNQKANETAKDLFNRRPDFTLYSCRKLYAQLSYLEFGKGSRYGANPSVQLWTAKVLGHAENDIETQNHYSHYKVVEQKEAPVDLLAKIETLTAKVDMLESKVSGSTPTFQTISKANKLEEYYKVIKGLIDSRDSKTSQSKAEELLNGKVPRSAVRSYFKKNVV